MTSIKPYLIQLLNDKVVKKLLDSKLVTNFNDYDYLTFKKLPESIELFGENVFHYLLCQYFYLRI